MSFTPNPSAILKNKKSNLNNKEAYQKNNLQIFLEQRITTHIWLQKFAFMNDNNERKFLSPKFLKNN